MCNPGCQSVRREHWDQSLRKSADILAKAEIEGERARTLGEWAKFELQKNNKEQGIELWEDARSIFEKLGANMEVERMSESPLEEARIKACRN